MSDRELRDLERRWRTTGDPGDEAALLRERVRLGDLTWDRLELAATVGHDGAARVVGARPRLDTRGALSAVGDVSRQLLTRALVRLARAALEVAGGRLRDEQRERALRLLGSVDAGATDEGLAEALFRDLWGNAPREASALSLVTQAAFQSVGRVAASFYCETTPELLSRAGVEDGRARALLSALVLESTRPERAP